MISLYHKRKKRELFSVKTSSNLRNTLSHGQSHNVAKSAHINTTPRRFIYTVQPLVKILSTEKYLRCFDDVQL